MENGRISSNHVRVKMKNGSISSNHDCGIEEKETAMYKVRLANAGDIPAMYEIYRPYADETTVSFEYGAPPAGDFAARISALFSVYPVLVCEEYGQVLGYAYAAPAFERRAYAWCAELSVYVENNARGRGIGSALERAIAALLKRLGYRKLYSLVTQENTGRVAFHEHVGYRQVAFFPEQGYKMGRWLGVVWLEKELCDAGCCERFPLKMSELSDADRTLEEVFA